MKAIIVFAAALTLFAAPAFAKSAAQTAAQDNMKSCSATWTGMSETQKKATTRKAFMSGCLSKSGAAAAPAMAATPPPAKTAASGNAMSSCAATWKTKSDADKKATTYKAFMSGCMKSGDAGASAAAHATAMTAAPAKAPPAKKVASMKAPAKSAIPTQGNTGTSARCKDGKTIPIKSHAGACSHHGGVAAWL